MKKIQKAALTEKKEPGTESNDHILTSKVGPDLNFAATEAFNLLRTNVIFSLSQGEKLDRGHIIGVTSPCPQDGKSFTSLNLAYSLAEAGNTVLLIDADMRRPALAKSLHFRNAPGLSNYLVDERPDIVHKSVLVDTLDVITAGNIPPNPSELVSSDRMNKTLHLFAEHYAYVIVDLPPVTAVSDPLVVSKYIDGMVIVLKHGYTRRSDVMNAVRQLRYVEANILGFVYNGYRRGGGYRRYRYGYRHYYKYGSYGSYTSTGRGTAAEAAVPETAGNTEKPTTTVLTDSE